MKEQPPSSGEDGPAIPANEHPAARDDADADFAPAHHTDSPRHFTTLDEGASAEAIGSEAFPWPPRNGESVVAALGRTWRDVMSAPTSFYRRMPADAPIGPALVYFLVIGVLSSGMRLFWDMVALLVLPAAAEGSLRSLFVPTSARDALISFFFAPLAMLGVLFVGAAITHALLKVMGGAGRRFGTTVRVFAYGQSASLLVIVPIAGTFVAIVWSFVLSVIGLREAHRTTTAKALLALLLPAVAIFFFFLLILLVVFMGAALIS